MGRGQPRGERLPLEKYLHAHLLAGPHARGIVEQSELQPIAAHGVEALVAITEIHQRFCEFRTDTTE
jgi:hypothetical protein